MTSVKKFDRILFGIVASLVGLGFFIFSSASLGLLARESASFSSVAFTQIALGIGGGMTALFIASRIHYRIWRRNAFYIFIGAVLLSCLVFVPGLGMEHGGARRWIDIAGFSLQPSEFLKIAFVIYMATWFSGFKEKKLSFKVAVIPFAVAILIAGAIMLLQRDTDTFLLMVLAGAVMFLVETGRWKEFFGIGAAGLMLIIVLAFVHPYIKSRLISFADPSHDPQGVGWQVKQSLIAVGSGGLHGRGFGQSVQKFEYLPEPIGDSIFAVYAEEFGFIGSFFLIALFTAFFFRGYRLASRAPDDFGMLLTLGIITMISAQAFLHMAAMVQFTPVLGLPLPFISHGGTAMLASLGAIGIVLNVSKYQKTKII